MSFFKITYGSTFENQLHTKGMSVIYILLAISIIVAVGFFIAFIILIVIWVIGLWWLEMIFYVFLLLVALVVVGYLAFRLIVYLYPRNSFIEYFAIACLGYYLLPIVEKHEYFNPVICVTSAQERIRSAKAVLCDR